MAVSDDRMSDNNVPRTLVWPAITNLKSCPQLFMAIVGRKFGIAGHTTRQPAHLDCYIQCQWCHLCMCIYLLFKLFVSFSQLHPHNMMCTCLEEAM